MDNGLNHKMKIRLLILAVLLFAVLAPFLVYRIVHIEFFARRDGHTYGELALENQLKDYTIPAARGNIVDCNGKVLAQNATVWTVVLYPSEIKAVGDKYKDDPATGAVKVEDIRRTIAQGLADILEMDAETVYEMTCRENKYTIVKRQVEKETADLVSEFSAEHKYGGYMGLEESTKRYYPYGDFASTLLGFTGIDNQGLAGLEYQYDQTLSGTPGRTVGLKNGVNADMPSQYESVIDPVNGDTLKLTIDEVAQHIVETNLRQAMEDHNVSNRVAGVVMDVKTGAILAMATLNGYDPNFPSQISDTTVLEKLSKLTGDAYSEALKQAQGEQRKNKIVGEIYEPGSVFKIITAAAALEEGKVTTTDTFTCTGALRVEDRVIHCWKRDGSHGTQTFAKAIQNSCNPVFIQVAQRLGVTTFMQYFEAFGLKEKTGIDISGEEIGISHTASSMGQVELAVSAFGQTNKVTPIQMITAVSAVANGGKLMRPYVVAETIGADGTVKSTTDPLVRRQVISEATSKTLCSLLADVVSIGSGKNAYVAGYRVAGKTGTSEKTDLKDEDGNKIEGRIASFCGFAPADDPQIAVLVLLDEPHSFSNYGGQIAAPVAGQIFSQLLPYLGVDPVYTAEELASLNVKTPSVTGGTDTEATKRLQASGLKIRIVGSGSKVVYQVPEAGSLMPKGGTVVVAMSGKKDIQNVTVPAVVGMSLTAANTQIVNKGLNITVVGAKAGSEAAKVSSQSPAAGEKVPAGTVVTVKILYEDSVE